MRMFRRVLTLGIVAGMVVIPASLPALAQTGRAADVTHRQSVLTEVSPTGAVKSSRVFTQLTVAGDGDVEVALPAQATRGLRNLDGFGKPRVDGDQVVYRLAATRDGASERSVADNTAELPVSLEIAYELDGAPIEPRDLVGKTGTVTVTYTVRNNTAEPTEIRYFDGRQRERFETVDVAVPMVGSLSTTLDPRFVDIKAPGASIAGDGRGSTVVQWSLLLFSPLGSEEQSVSYTAHVSDALVPEAVAQILPVDSKSFGSLRSTAASYKGAVESTRTLTINGVLIDGNVQLLADGAAKLLDGLGQLADGATQLADGLNETAAPGARQLADGTTTARDGSRELANGLSALGAGAGQLADGSTQLRAGGSKLAGGLTELAAGAGTAKDGADRIAGGLADANAAFEARILPGAAAINGGLAQIGAGMEQLGAGTAQAAPAVAGLPQIADGVGTFAGSIYAGADACDLAKVQAGQCGLLGSLQVANALLQQALPGLTQACTANPALAPACQAVGGAQQIVGGSTTKLTAGKPAADQLVAGAAALKGLVPLLEAYATNFGTADAPGPLLKGVRDLSAGAAQLDAGLKQFQSDAMAPLVAGSSQLAQGLPALAAGAQAASKGASDLSDGLGKFDDGTQQLAAGAGKAVDGATRLADGLVQIDDGANQLADGLGDAGDGASQLAEGLTAAEDGGQQIADGTVRLSEAGMQKLIEGVSDASAGSSLLYNTIKAIDARGSNGDGLAYGTVDGADASAVYKFEIAGVGSSDDGAATAAVRAAIAAGAFLAAGVLGLAMRRRLA
ncbi:hypothetical protein [Egicoccus sp. AB-alg6-2]|uniref:hypothetical protein n=1 Tax=Egicoccus sp. AB-alg6-2 TaxID=3242692 RepID=UPI00359E2472